MCKLTSNCPTCGAEIDDESTCGNCTSTDIIEPGKAHASNPAADHFGSSSMGAKTSLGMTDSELWFEVLAVLAVGVIPYIAGILGTVSYRDSLTPYWVVVSAQILEFACPIYVTVYLIHRSGEPYEWFGIVPFRMSDLAPGFVLFLMARIVDILCGKLMGESSSAVDESDGIYISRSDLVLMIVKYGIAALSEEVITRGYLITRFERLLRSRLAAVSAAAVLFATYHLYQGIYGAVHALLFGLLSGGAFLYFRSVWPLTVGHALVNIYHLLRTVG